MTDQPETQAHTGTQAHTHRERHDTSSRAVIPWAGLTVSPRAGAIGDALRSICETHTWTDRCQMPSAWHFARGAVLPVQRSSRSSLEMNRLASISGAGGKNTSNSSVRSCPAGPVYSASLPIDSPRALLCRCWPPRGRRMWVAAAGRIGSRRLTAPGARSPVTMRDIFTATG